MGANLSSLKAVRNSEELKIFLGEDSIEDAAIQDLLQFQIKPPKTIEDCKSLVEICRELKDEIPNESTKNLTALVEITANPDISETLDDDSLKVIYNGLFFIKWFCLTYSDDSEKLLDVKLEIEALMVPFLIKVITNVEITDKTYHIALEACDILAILIEISPKIDLFENDKNLVTSLLKNFTAQIPAPVFPFVQPSGFGHALASGMWSVMTVGMGSMNETVDLEYKPLSHSCIALLLKLVDSNTLCNSALCNMTDNKETNFSDLHYLLLANEEFLPFLKKMLRSNMTYRKFVIMATDLSLIIAPVLKDIYTCENDDYTKLGDKFELLQILCKDELFNQAIHSCSKAGSNVWYKEKLLKNIKLGGMIVIILLRSVLQNKNDTIFQKTCMNILVQMSVHFSLLDLYPSERLVGCLEVLLKKHSRLVSSSEDLDANNVEDLVKKLLVIITNALVNQTQNNPNLVYSLLYKREFLSSYTKKNEEFTQYFENVNNLLEHVSKKIDEQSEDSNDITDTSLLLGIIQSAISEYPKDRFLVSKPNEEVLATTIEVAVEETKLTVSEEIGNVVPEKSVEQNSDVPSIVDTEEEAVNEEKMETANETIDTEQTVIKTETVEDLKEIDSNTLGEAKTIPDETTIQEEEEKIENSTNEVQSFESPKDEGNQIDDTITDLNSKECDTISETIIVETVNIEENISIEKSVEVLKEINNENIVEEETLPNESTNQVESEPTPADDTRNDEIKDTSIVEPVSDAQSIMQEESVPTLTPADEPVIDEQSIIKKVTAEVLEEIPSNEDNEEGIIEANDEITDSTEVDAVHEEINKTIEETVEVQEKSSVETIVQADHLNDDSTTAEEDASAKTSDCIVASDEIEDAKVVESVNNQNKETNCENEETNNPGEETPTETISGDVQNDISNSPIAGENKIEVAVEESNEIKKEGVETNEVKVEIVERDEPDIETETVVEINEVEEITTESVEVDESKIEREAGDEITAEIVKVEKLKIESELIDEPKTESEAVEEQRTESEALENPNLETETVEEPKTEIEAEKEPSTEIEAVKELNPNTEVVEEPGTENELIEEPRTESETVGEIKAHSVEVGEITAESVEIDEPKTENEAVDAIVVESMKADEIKTDSEAVDETTLVVDMDENVKVDESKIENKEVDEVKVECNGLDIASNGEVEATSIESTILEEEASTMEPSAKEEAVGEVTDDVSETSSLVEFQAFNKEDQTPVTFLIDSKMLEKLLIRSESRIVITNFEIVPSGPVRNESGDSAIFSQEGDVVQQQAPAEPDVYKEFADQQKKISFAQIHNEKDKPTPKTPPTRNIPVEALTTNLYLAGSNIKFDLDEKLKIIGTPVSPCANVIWKRAAVV